MGKWVRKGPIVVGRRIAEWSGDTGGAATSFPADTLGVASFDTVHRVMRLWSYSPEGGDLLLTIPFGELVPEEGDWAGYPTGRFDPTNTPFTFYHGSQIKVGVKAYNGGGQAPAPLLRLYSNVFYE